MESFLEGYRRFRAKDWPEQRSHFEELAANGQKPKILVVACIDSRVHPSDIFDTAPGETLVLRNVASLVPPYAPDAAYHGTSAALEFAVKVLEVENIIVLGHAHCGGVNALLKGPPTNAQDFIGPWMSMATGARTRALRCAGAEEAQQACEHEVVKTSLTNLMTYPWIRDRVDAKKLELHGSWFGIGTGTLMLLKENGSFEVFV